MKDGLKPPSDGVRHCADSETVARAGSLSKALFLKWLGRVLMILGLAFVGLRLWAYRHSLADQIARPQLLLFLLLLAVLYTLFSLFLAFGWWLLLGAHEKGAEKPAWRTACSIYGQTQIAKYIPGNVFHFAGRHAAGVKQDLSHRQLLLAATLEILMLLIAAGMISLLALDVLPAVLLPVHIQLPGVAWILVAIAVLIFIAYLFIRLGSPVGLTTARWQTLIVAQFSYLLFFLGSAFLFLCLLSLFARNPAQVSAQWRLIFGSYTCAWAIGFVVPGVPAGLGVREALLIRLLTTSLHEETILVGTVLFRLVTTLGDCILFLTTLFLKRFTHTGKGNSSP
jgi:uncharacterized membrane protein YbhN (UPF0104 family)